MYEGIWMNARAAIKQLPELRKSCPQNSHDTDGPRGHASMRQQFFGREIGSCLRGYLAHALVSPEGMFAVSHAGLAGGDPLFVGVVAESDLP
jgi:hypothetical protein